MALLIWLTPLDCSCEAAEISCTRSEVLAMLGTMASSSLPAVSAAGGGGWGLGEVLGRAPTLRPRPLSLPLPVAPHSVRPRRCACALALACAYVCARAPAGGWQLKRGLRDHRPVVFQGGRPAPARSRAPWLATRRGDSERRLGAARLARLASGGPHWRPSAASEELEARDDAGPAPTATPASRACRPSHCVPSESLRAVRVGDDP